MGLEEPQRILRPRINDFSSKSKEEKCEKGRDGSPKKCREKIIELGYC
jgi:hypothetical protein